MVNIGISFIAIQVVKDFVKNAVKKGLTLARQQQINYKFGKGHFYWSGQPVEHKVKWGWKEINVADLDPYRWKVKHGVEVLNDAFKKAMEYEGASASPI